MALESNPGPHKSEAYILMIAEPYLQPTEAHISEEKKSKGVGMWNNVHFEGSKRRSRDWRK